MKLVTTIIKFICGFALIIIPQIVPKPADSGALAGLPVSMSVLATTIGHIISVMGIIILITTIFSTATAILRGDFARFPMVAIEPEDLTRTEPLPHKPVIQPDVKIYGCVHCGQLFVPGKNFKGFIPNCPNCGATIRLLDEKGNIQEME